MSSNGDIQRADQSMEYRGQEPGRFLVAEAERSGDAMRRGRAPSLRLALQAQSLRPVADEQWPNREEFLAILAHELRNPLMPIRCALEVIDNARGDPLVVERAHAIVKRQFAQMVRLLDDMLAAAAHGSVVLHKESLDLRSVLNSAVEAVKSLIDAKQHKLELQLPLEPVPLQADGTKLTQIVINLLTNAVKYTPAGGLIRLSAQRDDERGEVQVRVMDTGIGIPAKELHRIFDMFVRVDESNPDSHAGLGIGLALARQLATLHGGSISVHSEGPGLGSEFVLTLPSGESGSMGTDSPRTVPVLDAIEA